MRSREQQLRSAVVSVVRRNGPMTENRIIQLLHGDTGEDSSHVVRNVVLRGDVPDAIRSASGLGLIHRKGGKYYLNLNG